MKLLLTILLFASTALGQVQIVDDIGTCNEGDIGKWSAASKKFVCQPEGGGTIPSGMITVIDTGTCPASWSEVTALNGVTLIGTLAANMDVGDTGGSDDITPTVDSLEAAAQTFTGSSTTVPALGVGTLVNGAISAGTPAGTNSTSAVSGIVVDAHASHTHTYTEVPNHVHVQNINTGTTGGSNGYGVDTSTNGSGATAISTANPTGGVATGTTAGPSASLTHNVSNNGTAAAQTFTGSALGTHNHTITGSTATGSLTPLGSNGTSAVTGTLNQFDNRSAFIKVIFCKKD